MATFKMSREAISKHYSRILTLWPKDPLRPEVSFEPLLRKRVADKTTGPEQGRQINALYSLLDNRYTKKVTTRLFYPHCQAALPTRMRIRFAFCIFAMLALNADGAAVQYPVSPRMMSPASNPAYYTNLAAELQQAPGRSWFERYMNKWKGFLRFS
ncbi:hypothetical protein LTR16_001202 [Cryomyces antarcticus]|uniref:Uncharacterized protein n=1 Tax=Cryomyces antarcticus TaxID=329879 RepID=A0ABR0LQD5_9PEZI|nr:hypothetical protein LTR39_000771 [Cryomyces antarcticus]KAK5020355.1 hypothetical protein LTR60_000591 [Cryomyces antarcticus]KAK5141458.1 hypothetical protein LTR04_002594 [Oleoguttula sp. CCFEE 6159]KAK5201861.1 hypothetical protein LTR16_001202 [Cryomyces antarcticus]